MAPKQRNSYVKIGLTVKFYLPIYFMLFYVSYCNKLIVERPKDSHEGRVSPLDAELSCFKVSDLSLVLISRF